MDAAVREGGVDVVGFARPLCVDLHFARRALAGTLGSFTMPRPGVGLRVLDAGLENFWHQRQLQRLAGGDAPWTGRAGMWVDRCYCLGVMAVTNYVLDPARSPQAAAAVGAVVAAALAALAALAWTGGDARVKV